MKRKLEHANILRWIRIVLIWCFAPIFALWIDPVIMYAQPPTPAPPPTTVGGFAAAGGAATGMSQGAVLPSTSGQHFVIAPTDNFIRYYLKPPHLRLYDTIGSGLLYEASDQTEISISANKLPSLPIDHNLWVEYLDGMPNTEYTVVLYSLKQNVLTLSDRWTVKFDQNGNYRQNLGFSSALTAGRYYLGVCNTVDCLSVFVNSTFTMYTTGVELNLLAPAGNSPEPSIGNFSGQWQTNFAEMTLQQDGNKVSGSYAWYGNSQSFSIQGSVNGDTLTGHYMNDSSTSFTFNLSADHNSFDGFWLSRETGQHHQWCGVHSGPLPDGCGFSGVWQTCCDTESRAWTAQLTQDGDQVTGQYFFNSSTSYGVIVGQLGIAQGADAHYKVLGQYTDEDGNTGGFRWDLVNYDSQQFQGCWRGSQPPSHSWCGWRDSESQPAQCQPDPPCP